MTIPQAQLRRELDEENLKSTNLVGRVRDLRAKLTSALRKQENSDAVLGKNLHELVSIQTERDAAEGSAAHLRARLSDDENEIAALKSSREGVENEVESLKVSCEHAEVETATMKSLHNDVEDKLAAIRTSHGHAEFENNLLRKTLQNQAQDEVE